MPKLSFAAFGHVSRLNMMASLTKAFGRHTKISVHIDGDPFGSGVWNMAKKAWLSFDRDADFHVVLQDDAILCKGFLEELPDVLSLLTEDSSACLCTSYDSLSSPSQLLSQLTPNHRWVKSQFVRNGQCLVQPVNQIEDFVRYADMNVRKSYYHDDGRLEMYLRDNNRYIYHAVPSLVSHRVVPSVYQGEDSIPFDAASAYRETNFIGRINRASSLSGWDKQENVLHYDEPWRDEELWALGRLPLNREKISELNLRNNRMFPLLELLTPYPEAIERDRLERGLL